MESEIRILFCGGGSGGHINPLVAVAEILQDTRGQLPGKITMHWFGSLDQYSREFARVPVAIHPILTGKLRRYFSLQNFIDIPKFFVGLIQAWWKMFLLMPDVIFSKGGPGALPVVLCGWFYRIPIVIHESDSVPGLTTLLTARFAKKIILSFEAARQYFDSRKVLILGNPVRRSFQEKRITQEAAKESLGFNPGEPVLLVLGGSQGAQRINRFVALNLKEFLTETQILHQAGTGDFLDTKKLSEAVLIDLPVKTEVEHRYSLVPYFEEKKLTEALSAADVVLARSGSGTLFEIAPFGTPSVLVPLDESAKDHQRSNAYIFAGGGGAIVIEEENLNAQTFVHELKKILSNPTVRDNMSRSALQFAKPRAAEEIAKQILQLV
ncbi:MAG: UDP-N-acetylglucosamine--N-acetylmuramyl-(pentapeptide) pyrophosphoryl-undecaprenol N-acetylglucosamine transferase [Patescibacteria group bacterium]